MNSCEFDFSRHYLYYRQDCLRKSNVNKKIYIGTNWITYYFLIAQYAPINVFAQLLSLSHLKISSGGHTILHALCATKSTDYARTYRCIRTCVEKFGKGIINIKDVFNKSCIFYLNGPYLDYFKNRGAKNCIAAARYSTECFRGEYFVPDFAVNVIDILIRQRNTELIRMVISRLPQAMDICFKMALVVDLENEGEWMQKAIDYGAPNEIGDEWKDQYLIHNYGPSSLEREQLLVRRIEKNSSMSHFITYLEMMLNYPEAEFDLISDINWNSMIPNLEDHQIKYYTARFIDMVSGMKFSHKLLLIAHWLLHCDDYIWRGVHFRDQNNITLLHIISKYPSSWPLSFIQKCLDAGGNPNARSNHGLTPFHFLLSNEQLDLCKLFMKYGAHVDIRFCKNFTIKELHNKLNVIMSLKCLAVNTILDYNVIYNNSLLPQCVINFINMHKKACICERE